MTAYRKDTNMAVNWPAAAVIVAIIAGCTTCGVADSRHRNDDSVACSKAGGEWHQRLFSRTCEVKR